MTVFRDTSLRPVPPGESKHNEVRYLDIHADDQLDEELVAHWIRQASELSGGVPYRLRGSAHHPVIAANRSIHQAAFQPSSAAS